MTINLTELRDEPLGEHLSNYVSFTNPTSCMCGVSQRETDVEADSGADSVFKFDFKSLGDEALGTLPGQLVAPCVYPICYTSLAVDAGAWRVEAARRNPI